MHQIGVGFMRFFIYSRKSKFTGKGESVENQIQLCKEYIERMFGSLDKHEIMVFEDEGFSGKNLARPQFQRMLSLVHQKKADYVICYRLDRVSRNVSDFSSLIEDFSSHKTGFISIKEQFDTTTPMGRAMMFIASVFAQLERETIAERIQDNMLQLAHTGRWLGGTTALGFKSTAVTKEMIDGKALKSFKLSPNQDEMVIVHAIFQKYREFRSLTQVASYLRTQKIKTRAGKDFTIVAIREILTNPVYCVADELSYHYFITLGCEVCSDKADFSFDGIHGISSYNRTNNDGKRQTKNPPSEWIVTVGRHLGTIPSSEWIDVQKTLKSNQPKKFAGKIQNPTSLLSGILTCKNCGSFMRPRVNSRRHDENGISHFYYMCDQKKKTKGQLCNAPNLNGNKLDQIVCGEILKFEDTDSKISQKLAELKKRVSKGFNGSQSELNFVQKQIKAKNDEIDSLIQVLGRSGSSSKLFEYTSCKVKELDQQITELKSKELELTQRTNTTSDFDKQIAIMENALHSFANSFEQAAIPERRAFLRSIIKEIVWDGKEINIFLYGEPRK